jgi:hypothetical protein
VEGRGTENVFHGDGFWRGVVDWDFGGGDVSAFDGGALVIVPILILGILFLKDMFVFVWPSRGMMHDGIRHG